ncbi:hypothetical protein L218DRAFT_600813 [Marasmius fiardii PR-910]|nr:hypothetical protein L218DRAFT_600813 [Marasmius fiardii PR-910]
MDFRGPSSRCGLNHWQIPIFKISWCPSADFLQHESETRRDWLMAKFQFILLLLNLSILAWTYDGCRSGTAAFNFKLPSGFFIKHPPHLMGSLPFTSMTTNFISIDTATRRACLLIGWNSSSAIPSSFLEDGYSPFPPDAVVNLPQSLRSLSVCVERSFNPITDLRTLSSILSYIATHRSSVTNVFILVTSRQWGLTDQLSRQFLEWFHLWNFHRDRSHFRLVTSCSLLRTEVVAEAGKVRTSAAVPIDIVSTDILNSLAGLPELQCLEILRPLMSPLHLYNRRLTLSALEQHLTSFRNLKKLNLSLLLGDALVPILQMIPALPHCGCLQFHDWAPSLVYSVTERHEVVLALREGLAGFNHLRALILPGRDLLHSIQGILRDLEDLEEIIVVAGT